LGAVFLLGKSKFYKEKWDISNSEIMDRKNTKLLAVDSNITISEAFLPYYVLTFITLFILLIPPVNKFLSSWKVGFSFPETSTGYGIINEAITLYSPISPFTHASTFLLISGLIGYSYLYSKGKIKKGGGKRIFRNIVKKTTPSSIAIVCLIIMSRIMSGTGQTTVLATGTSMVLGKAYVIVAPLIGLLGSFMTSSNMSSNILFGGFQKTTSELLGLNQAAIIGAQTAGGAIGNAMAPGSIILGTTTAKILGSEGEVLKRTLPIAIGTSVLCGIILYIALIII
jgi:lactate permease